MQTDKLDKTHISVRALHIWSLRLKLYVKVPTDMFKKHNSLLSLFVFVIITILYSMKCTSHFSAWLQWHHCSLCGYRDTRCTKEWVKNILEEGWCWSFSRYGLYTTRQCVCTVHAPPSYRLCVQDPGMEWCVDVAVCCHRCVTIPWKWDPVSMVAGREQHQ
jgi:hypothetical protein